MRFLPALLVFVATLTGRVFAQGNSDPIVTNGTIPDQSVVTTVGTPAINLQNYFAIPSIQGQVVQFKTSALPAGANTFNVEMNSTAAPNTAANFLAYVNANRLTNTIIHRTDKSVGIIQGGSYYPQPDSTYILSPVIKSSDSPIALETGDTLPNSRGTIAMARSNDPNSATSGWFINDTDNSYNLPPASSSGYAAFGRVTGTGMTVVDALYALPPLCGNVTVQSSSTSSASVTIDSTTAPANFGTGWTLLGSQVVNVTGNFVTLAANANRDIFSDTLVPYTLDYLVNGVTDLSQLPALASLTSPSASVYFNNLVTMTGIQAVPIFPATAGGPSVVTFSAVSSDPSLVSATVIGSNLYVGAAKNLTGSASVAVIATDSNGNQVTSPAFTVSVTRKVVDFNSDGVADLVFQNNVGQIGVWHNASSANSAFLYNGGLGDWRVVVAADWNNDGVTDLIFQNNVGQIAVWYGGSSANAAYIYAGGLGDWRVVGVADINHDGVPDLVFQNTIGQIAVWYSGLPANAAYIYGGGMGDWRVKFAGDINGDGFADLVFQNNVGQIAVWYSGSYTNAAYIYNGGLGDWRVTGVADINGDGIPDLLFQNTIGQIAVWYSGAYTNAHYIYGGGLGDWHLH